MGVTCWVGFCFAHLGARLRVLIYQCSQTHHSILLFFTCFNTLFACSMAVWLRFFFFLMSLFIQKAVVSRARIQAFTIVFFFSLLLSR